MATLQRLLEALLLAALLAVCRAAVVAQVPFSNVGTTSSTARAMADQLRAMLTRNQSSELRTSFQQFKTTTGRMYATSTEEDKRYNLYVSKLAEIVAANSDPARTYVSGLNRFADRTPEELQALLMRNLPAAALTPKVARRLAADDGPVMATPSNMVKRKLQATGVDWRAMGGVTPVRDQGQCGSCWAFAATAAIESAYLIGGYATDVDLSEQHLLSCSGGGSCNGGDSSAAMSYVVSSNQTIESAFPYTASDQSCSSAIRSNPVVSLSANVREVTYGNVAALQQAVARQPIVFYFNVMNNFFTVSDGIYNGPCSDKTINHAMLVVGYGYDANNNGYWIVKNSWGTDWNSAGYIKVAMLGNGKGLCGMYAYGLYYPDISPADRGFDKRISGGSGTTCSSGYYASGSSCVKCVGAGAITPSGATSQSQCYCKQGGSKYYKQDVGCTTCDTATTTLTSMDGQTCSCASGFQSWSPDTGACAVQTVTCSSGYYASGSSCVKCAGSGASTPSGATSQSQCYCRLNGSKFYKQDVGCTYCDTATTTRFSSDGQTCSCAAGFQSWSADTGACQSQSTTCDNGYYASGGGCVPCAGSGASSDTGGTDESACYCTSGTDYYLATVGCTACDYDSTFGSSDGRTCDCYTGYQDWNPDTGACVSSNAGCPSGQYDDGTGCTSCAGDGSALTDSGATSEADCYCSVDYYLTGVGCTPCDPTSTTGSSADGHTCTCKKNYKNWSPDTGACTPSCTPGFYQSGNACVRCALANGVQATTPAGALSEGDCKCPSSTTKPYWYKAGAGCSKCPTPSTTGKSFDGKTCTCATGYSNWDPIGGTCASNKAPTCTARNGACGGAKPACCPGTTCKRFGPNQKCA